MNEPTGAPTSYLFQNAGESVTCSSSALNDAGSRSRLNAVLSNVIFGNGLLGRKPYGQENMQKIPEKCREIIPLNNILEHRRRWKRVARRQGEGEEERTKGGRYGGGEGKREG